MLRIGKRNVALMIGLGVALLLLCIAVVFVIDTLFSLDPWGDGDVEALWYFLVSSLFFPGALRRYRADRRTERNVPWYHRLDLIACLLGLAFGLLFVQSVVQKWFVFDALHGIAWPPVLVLVVLPVAGITIDLCWIALVLLLLTQMFKHIKQQKKALQPPEE